MIFRKRALMHIRRRDDRLRWNEERSAEEKENVLMEFVERFLKKVC